MSSQTEPLLRGGQFFVHAPESIFTPEQFSSDEQLMIQTAEQFSRKEVLPVAEALDHQQEDLMPQLIRKAGELGFCGADSPERFGGLGLGKNLAARMLEFLSLNGSMSVTLGVTSGISQVGLALFGTDAQREKYLPPLASGEQIGAYCLSEPNSGSDALSLSTRADRRGDKWVLNGTKMWISNAKWAEQFLVMAKVDGERVTAFLVERGFPGVHVAREEHKMGLKGSSTARVILENAEVPMENMLYEEGRGHVVAFNALNIGRFKLSSMSIGPARQAIGEAAIYACDRKQFGQSLSQFGLIQKKLVESAILFYAAESMIYRTGALIDSAFEHYHASATDPISANRAAAEEFAIECSSCKIFSTEAESQIVDECLQVFGGYGFTEEFPMARIYRDARVSRIYEGTNEINRLFLGDRIRRKLGESPMTPSSFISELAQKAYAKLLPVEKPDQLALGALADLVLLEYAQQSASIRAKQVGGIYGSLSAGFSNWANIRAAEAYQSLTGEPVSLPAPISFDFGAVASAVFEKKTPL